MADLTLATRGSPLAMRQAQWVAERLARRHRGLEVGVVAVETSGDRDRHTPVTHLTEVGAFVRAVQQAVLDGRADAAVHSCKDLPVSGPEGLATFYPRREEPWDVLCGTTLSDLPPGARVGTGSPRRERQLAALRPDVVVVPIRGNVDTRIRKVTAGEFDGVIVAEAGLRRLGRADAIGYRFTLEQMVPAPAQGALAVEVRRGERAEPLVAAIDDEATRLAVTAERTVLALSGAGCRAALGVWALTADGIVHVTGFVSDAKGSRRATASGVPHEAAAELAALLEVA